MLKGVCGGDVDVVRRPWQRGGAREGGKEGRCTCRRRDAAPTAAAGHTCRVRERACGGSWLRRWSARCGRTSAGRCAWRVPPCVFSFPRLVPPNRAGTAPATAHTGGGAAAGVRGGGRARRHPHDRRCHPLCDALVRRGGDHGRGAPARPPIPGRPPRARRRRRCHHRGVRAAGGARPHAAAAAAGSAPRAGWPRSGTLATCRVGQSGATEKTQLWEVCRQPSSSVSSELRDQETHRSDADRKTHARGGCTGS